VTTNFCADCKAKHPGRECDFKDGVCVQVPYYNWREDLTRHANDCSCYGWCDCHIPEHEPGAPCEFCERGWHTHNHEKGCLCDYGTFLGLEETYRHWMMRYATATSVMSFVVYKDPNFQELVKMGEAIVPLLLKDIYEDKGWVGGGRERVYCSWAAFTLLRQLVKPEKQPVLPDSHRGRHGKIRDMWVKWGQENGYLPCTTRTEIESPSGETKTVEVVIASTVLGLLMLLSLIAMLLRSH